MTRVVRTAVVRAEGARTWTGPTSSMAAWVNRPDATSSISVVPSDTPVAETTTQSSVSRLAMPAASSATMASAKAFLAGYDVVLDGGGVA